MADERYQWLDPEAAERLLRGEPVDPADPAARTRAAALADALDAARASAAPVPGAPLAGEEAALTAFRTATAARAAARAAAPAAVSADLGRVRLTAAPGAGRRWGRSLRYGLAAALAAVTVGGVAVAAGTGVLPLGDREPSRTVTAAETATPPDPRATPSAGTENHPDPSRDAGHPADTHAPGASPTARPDATASGETPGRGPAEPTAGQRDDTEGERRTRACREYRAGRLGAADRRRLSGALRAGDSLRAYCDRLLAAGTPVDEKGGGEDGDKDKGEDRTGNTGGNDAGDKGDDKKDGAEGNDSDLGHGTVPTPSDSARKRAKGNGTDKPDPKDRPRLRPKAVRSDTRPPSRTEPDTRRDTRAAAAAPAPETCPTGAPGTGV
ncbi:hypothetical protein SNE510_42970 [Streptomyces sp. NE5-10]|uniref:hypothetical protein n=1 Tax=Streptomyces sp. NE5-10 TaxID=2759674 RepID=UPI0019044458|nr:hypothetical protein [Streptomyces sp. NE5-10]GHJ94778.1 hypothetical protein SNE510_42970 [Streptomyces sp. NE5-10]